MNFVDENYLNLFSILMILTLGIDFVSITLYEYVSKGDESNIIFIRDGG